MQHAVDPTCTVRYATIWSFGADVDGEAPCYRHDVVERMDDMLQNIEEASQFPMDRHSYYIVYSSASVDVPRV